MRAGFVLVGIVALLAAVLVWSNTRAPLPTWDCSGPPPDLGLRFESRGTLALLWERDCQGARPKRKILLSDGDGSTQVSLEDGTPLSVSWRSRSQLLIQRLLEEGSAQQHWDSALVDRQGRVVRKLSDEVRRGNAAFSPDGRWLLYEVLEGKRLVLALSDFEQEERIVARSSADLQRPLWQPETGAIAAIHPEEVEVPPGSGRRQDLARIALVSRDLRDVRVLYDGPPGENRPRKNGAYPLWWGSDGIYASSEGALLRCDPEGAGCVVVYEPIPLGAVHFGVELAPGDALVGVLPMERYVMPELESRAREIHRIDLSTGKVKAVWRLPEHEYVSSMSWSPEPPTPAAPHS